MEMWLPVWQSNHTISISEQFFILQPMLFTSRSKVGSDLDLLIFKAAACHRVLQVVELLQNKTPFTRAAIKTLHPFILVIQINHQARRHVSQLAASLCRSCSRHPSVITGVLQPGAKKGSVFLTDTHNCNVFVCLLLIVSKKKKQKEIFVFLKVILLALLDVSQGAFSS